MKLTSGYDRYNAALRVLTQEQIVINRDGTWQRGEAADD